MHYMDLGKKRHLLPGRLRINVSRLKGNKCMSEKIVSLLLNTCGVLQASASIYTGNVLVLFNHKQLEAGRIENLINRANTLTAIDGKKSEVAFDDACRQVVRKHYGYIRLLPLVVAMSLVDFIFSRNLLKLAGLILVSSPRPAYKTVRTAFGMIAERMRVKGILVKNPCKLVNTAVLDCIIFDKTGTLTTGNADVMEILTAGRNSEEKVIDIAASCEWESTHPFAKAIIKEAHNRGISIHEAYGIHEYAGRGVTGMVDEKIAVVGNKQLMNEKAINTSGFVTRERRLKHSGNSPIYVAYDKKVMGLIGIRDSIKSNSLETFERIRELGVKEIIIISGDSEELVERLAFELGADSFKGGLLPQAKADIVKDVKKEGMAIAMVGDGLNDFPAMNAADVGMVITSSSLDYGDNYPDIIIANGDIGSIPSIVKLGKLALENVYQSFTLTAGINIIGTLLIFTGGLTPLYGFLLFALNNLVAELNSSGLKKYKLL